MTDNAQALNALLREDFAAFIRLACQTVSPADKYMDNWHIKAIAYYLTRVRDGSSKRLIITMPPRHMKSIAASVAFPAWVLGHDPRKRFICVSYSPDLATRLSLDCRSVMQSQRYRECFPDTVLNHDKNTQTDFSTTLQGFRLATSVGGALTGMGCDYLIIDDPHKADDAQSSAKRQQVLDWYRNTAVTRLNDPTTGRVVVIQQRFNEEDLAGFLLESGDWNHLNLAAIAEQMESIDIGPGKIYTRAPGEALHPQRIPIAELNRMKSEMGSYAFAAQYQQQPGPAGGGIVKWEWFKYFDRPLRKRPDGLIILSWDLACTNNEHSSYSVCVVLLYQDGRFYLLNILRERMESPALLKRIPEVAAKYKANMVILENVGVGKMIYQQLRHAEIYNGDGSLEYLGNTPKGDKATRLMQVVHLIEQEKVLLPRIPEPWIEPFRKELQHFPNGKYDDQVDAFSQALLWFYNRTQQPRSRIMFC